MKSKNLAVIGLVVVLAAVAGYLFWPRERGGGTRQGADLHANTQVRNIVSAMMIYSQTREGRLPAPDKMVSTLVSAGLAKEDLFTVPNGPSPAFYYVQSKSSKPFVDSAAGDLIVYSDPALSKVAGVAAGYADGHVEWVEGEAATALIAGVSGRATGLK